MKFRQTLAHQSRGTEIVTNQLSGKRVRFLQRQQLVESLVGRGRRFRPGSGILEIAMQFSKRELPRIAFVGYEALQHGDIFPLTVAGAVIDPSGQRRDVRKQRVRSQEASNLEVGIDTSFDASKELDDKAVAVHDR